MKEMVNIDEGIAFVAPKQTTLERETSDDDVLHLDETLPHTREGLDNLLRNYLWEKGYIDDRRLSGLSGLFYVRGLNVISGIERFMDEIGTEKINISSCGEVGFQARFDDKIYSAIVKQEDEFRGEIWTHVMDYQ